MAHSVACVAWHRQRPRQSKVRRAAGSGSGGRSFATLLAQPLHCACAAGAGRPQPLTRPRPRAAAPAAAPAAPPPSASVISILRERGLIQEVTSDDLEVLSSKARLSVYCGFDPTADSLHLGNLLGIIVLAWFQR